MTDTVYRERAHLVALLAAIYPSTWNVDPQEPDWRVVYVDLPTGQASWHISPNDTDLFKHVFGKDASGIWDNHSTEVKYDRIDKLTYIIVTEEHEKPAVRRIAELEAERDRLAVELRWVDEQGAWGNP